MDRCEISKSVVFISYLANALTFFGKEMRFILNHLKVPFLAGKMSVMLPGKQLDFLLMMSGDLSAGSASSWSLRMEYVVEWLKRLIAAEVLDAGFFFSAQYSFY